MRLRRCRGNELEAGRFEISKILLDERARGVEEKHSAVVVVPSSSSATPTQLPHARCADSSCLARNNNQECDETGMRVPRNGRHMSG